MPTDAADLCNLKPSASGVCPTSRILLYQVWLAPFSTEAFPTVIQDFLAQITCSKSSYIEIGHPDKMCSPLKCLLSLHQFEEDIVKIK